MVTKKMYILEYRRNEYRFHSSDNWVMLGKAWDKVSIERQMDEFYNLFIQEVKREDTFNTSSIYTDLAIIEFKGGVIQLKISQIEFEDYE